MKRDAFAARLREILDSFGLGAAFEPLAAQIAPAINVRRKRVAHAWIPKVPASQGKRELKAYATAYDEMVRQLRTAPLPFEAIPLGASRLGGQPDLAAGFQWPVFQGRHLGFLGQFNLAEIPSMPGRDALPAKGQLAFFYEWDKEPWGFDPADRGSALVVYDASAKLVRHPLPADVQDPDIAARVTYEPALSIPKVDEQTFDWKSLGVEADVDWYEVDDALRELRAPRPQHQLLGEPYRVQNEMRAECQFVSNGLDCGGETGWAKGLADASLVAGIEDWVLLCQWDSDDTDEDDGPGIGHMWGDCGLLYFWIRKQDLARADFSGTWTILQCS